MDKQKFLMGYTYLLRNGIFSKKSDVTYAIVSYNKKLDKYDLYLNFYKTKKGVEKAFVNFAYMSDENTTYYIETFTRDEVNAVLAIEEKFYSNFIIRGWHTTLLVFLLPVKFF